MFSCSSRSCSAFYLSCLILFYSETVKSCITGWSGLFCPCVLFGRNVEQLREDIPWSNACVCHALCVEGGLTLAAATALFHGIDPRTSFLICEGLLFTWWMCAIYTGLFRQSLQKQYHLKVISIFWFFRIFMLSASWEFAKEMTLVGKWHEKCIDVCRLSLPSTSYHELFSL